MFISGRTFDEDSSGKPTNTEVFLLKVDFVTGEILKRSVFSLNGGEVNSFEKIEGMYIFRD